jgi:hypothetical protein
MNNSVGFWLHAWHDCALHSIRKRQEAQQRVERLHQLTGRYLLNLDAWAVEPVFRALVSIVAASRAARLHQLKVTTGKVFAGNLAKMDIANLARAVFREWHRSTLTSEHARQLAKVEHTRARAVQSMLTTSDHHGSVSSIQAVFHMWTHLAKDGRQDRICDEADRQQAVADRQQALARDQHALLKSNVRKAINSAFMASDRDTCKVLFDNWQRVVQIQAHSDLKTGFVGRLFGLASNDLMSSIFAEWKWLQYVGKQGRLKLHSRRHRTPLVSNLVARAVFNSTATMLLEVFTTWKSHSARAACASGWHRLREHISSSFGMLMALQESRGPCVEVVETFFAWARTAYKLTASTKAAFARATLYRLLGKSVVEQMVSSARSAFYGWARLRLKRKNSQANQTSAVLTHWASTQVLARLTLQGWTSIVVQRKLLEGELKRVGGQHHLGARRVVSELASLRLSEFMHAILMAWQEAMLIAGRGSRYATPAQFALMQRRAAMGPAGVATFQMLSAARGMAVAIAWNAWWTATTVSKMEGQVETHMTTLDNIRERQDLLIGYTLLIWTQEKALAFARTALLAWCRVSISAWRKADVAALTDERAMLEETCYYERNRRVADVGQLVSRVFLDNDLSWYQICFLEWKRAAREVDGRRRVAELQNAEALAHERIHKKVHTALVSIAHGNGQTRTHMLLCRMAMVLWNRETHKNCRLRIDERSKLRMAHNARTMATLFCSTHPGSAGTQMRLAFFAWKSFMALEHSLKGTKGGRLSSDLQMLVGLLEQSSSTIEELRVRLLLVRIFGLIRRQVFMSWLHVVDAKHARQLAHTTQSPNYSIQQQAYLENVALGRVSSSAALSESAADDQTFAGRSQGIPPLPSSDSASARYRGNSGGIPQIAFGDSPHLGSPMVPKPESERSAGSATKSREALVRQLQQAREALAQPRH